MSTFAEEFMKVAQSIGAVKGADFANKALIDSTSLTDEERGILADNWAFMNHMVDDMLGLFAKHAGSESCTTPACVSNGFVDAMTALERSCLLTATLHAAIARLYELTKESK